MMISGLVVADQPIETVSLVAKGEVCALSFFNPTAEGQQMFTLILAQLNKPTLDKTSFEIAVRTQGGREHRTAFTVQTGRDAAQAAHVIDGPVCDPSVLTNTTPPIVLYVEMVAVDRNRVLHVVGWAVAHSLIENIHAFGAGQRLGSAQLGQPRDDVAAGYSDYPNARFSGFKFSTALPEGATLGLIAIEAIDYNGSVNRVVMPAEFDAVVTDEPVPVAISSPPPHAQLSEDPRRTIFIHCDEATLSTDGEFLVSGWAVCAIGVATVTVHLDDGFVGNAELGLPRPDVGKEYSEIPQARYSGFRLKRKSVALAYSGHLIGIRACNGLGDVKDIAPTIIAVNRLSATSQPTSSNSENSDEFRFSVDNPVVIDGRVPHPVNGRLVIEGWAVARSGIEAVNILIDGQSLGQAYYGTARRDVESIHPGWTDAFRSGFIFHCPPGSLAIGTHTISLRARSKAGMLLQSDFQIDVEHGKKIGDFATIRRYMSYAEADLYQDILSRLNCRPHFRIFLRVKTGVSSEAVEATLQSLAKQVYVDWHLVMVIGTKDSKKWLAIADRAGLRDHVTVTTAASPGHFVTKFSDIATSLVGVLAPGDELGCDALAEIAIAHGLHGEAQFLYADEDRVSPSSKDREPFFKPNWSPDLLLSNNYVGRPWFATTDLFIAAKITLESIFAEQGDYDAVIRCTELATHIHHLPKLLCRRGDVDSTSFEAERRLLQVTAARRGIKADLLPGCVPGTWRLKRTASVKGKVSIIIPTCAAKGYIATCLKTLRAKTAYRNFEIICIDNIPSHMSKWKKLIRRGADKVVDIPGAFNWSRFNNHAVKQATGKYLLFLNDDIEVQQEGWLDAMLEHAQRPEVGIVGPQLLYPDRKVQHAGIFLTTLGAGRHSFRFLAEDDPGYFGLALTQRNVIAVTGACMLMRRESFERIGWFDEAHEVVNNDVDLCLRAWRTGLSVVYTPYAQLIHHELASRENMKDIFDAGHFAKQWRSQYAIGDPFFSPKLSKFADEYTPDTEPARAIIASRPLFRKEDIQRILAVKLDHIGDLITSLPALRRLRKLFPAARIHLLASRAAKDILAGDDCVDELIEFEFFHSRSGLGQKDVTVADLLALTERLAPYRFDLAIDLRKQMETRHILQYVPARLRAGYNHLGRFPWLDVSLEWEGDNQLHRKSSHVSDDLVRLVDAFATAGEAVRAGPSSVVGNGKVLASLPAAARALFRKPVVAVHPGVGAIMRQWMPEYFAAVIDLLIEKNGVNVVVIGGHDEVDLVKEVLGHVANRKNVLSVAGRTSLGDLTAILGSCVLYLGNNSGPQHIAASLGIPTVGVYSGVVDASEWGPTGPRAIALQRDMVCSPCYLVKPEDCVRDMACLKRLEPSVVHQYCEMMLGRSVQALVVATPLNEKTKGIRLTKRFQRTVASTELEKGVAGKAAQRVSLITARIVKAKALPKPANPRLEKMKTSGRRK
jgi:O-antigen biosynthesis protein